MVFPRPLDSLEVLFGERVAVQLDAIAGREDDEPAVKDPAAQEVGAPESSHRLSEEFDRLLAGDARYEGEPPSPVAVQDEASAARATTDRRKRSVFTYWSERKGAVPAVM